VSAPGPEAAQAKPARLAKPAQALAAAGGRPPSRHLPRSAERVGTRNEFLDVQRARLIGTITRAVAEVGYPKLSITQLVARAGVSRKTFYDLFADQEDAFLAAFDDALDRIGEPAARAYAQRGAWEERVRAALETVLGALDEEPELAHLCVMEAPRAGPRVLERRAGIIDRLAGALDEGRRGGRGRRGSGPPPLTAHSLAAGALSVVHDRLLLPSPGPLSELVGPLMSMIVFPYRGPAAAAREIRRPARGPARPRSPRQPELSAGNPLGSLGTRLTYRTIQVLSFVAGHAGASNREIAEGAGVADQGQISKLLIRLASLDLIENVVETPGRGFANAWRITPKGEEIRRAVKL
jgi:AcrR family transcriptional regulator